MNRAERRKLMVSTGRLPNREEYATRQIEKLAEKAAIHFADSLVEEDTMSTPAELLPCPHCGGAHLLLWQGDDQHIATQEENGNDLYWQVVCDHLDNGCGASGGYRATKEEAAQHWNTRPPQAPPKDAVRTCKGCGCAEGDIHSSECPFVFNHLPPDPPKDAEPWVCTNCQQTNSSWAATCGRCERAKTERIYFSHRCSHCSNLDHLQVEYTHAPDTSADRRDADVLKDELREQLIIANQWTAQVARREDVPLRIRQAADRLVARWNTTLEAIARERAGQNNQGEK